MVRSVINVFLKFSGPKFRTIDPIIKHWTEISDYGPGQIKYGPKFRTTVPAWTGTVIWAGPLIHALTERVLERSAHRNLMIRYESNSDDT